MPFFSSLTYTGTRVGGQRERQTQSFEAGTAYFPRDYPITDAYVSYADQRADEEKARWERKPPAKRPSYEKLGTRSPWRPDWEVVLGVDTTGSRNEDLITTQREVPLPTGGKNVRPWLLRGVEVSVILENASQMLNHSAGLLNEINKLRMKRSQDPLVNIRPDDLWKGALISVRLVMCRRGAPDDLAAIYSVEDEEARKWKKVLNRSIKPSTEPYGDASQDEIEVSRENIHNPLI